MSDLPPELPTGWDLRTQTLRDAYWAHREVPNRHRDEMCEDYCFPDIVERWVKLMVERTTDMTAEVRLREYLESKPMADTLVPLLDRALAEAVEAYESSVFVTKKAPK
jgi:hypothetical protein